MKLEYAKDLVAAGWELELIEDHPSGFGAAVAFKGVNDLFAAIAEATARRCEFGDPVSGFIKAMSALSLEYEEGTGTKHIATKPGVAY